MFYRKSHGLPRALFLLAVTHQGSRATNGTNNPFDTCAVSGHSTHLNYVG
jgi:hypothetical protein